jgi:uncharacterized membrane protein YgdD (TMEM256/DUF423 family)
MIGPRPHSTMLVIAGLSGALGVALSAMAAHRADGANLSTAANMLLFHAPAFLALAVMHISGVRRISTYALTIGLALFAGDLMARTYLGVRLFPMAAPTGGVLMIVGWMGIGVSAFLYNKTA